MNTFSLIAIGLTGALCAITIKKTHPEFAILISLATGIIMLLEVLEGFSQVFSRFSEIINQSNIKIAYFETALKACALAYITQFASELCKDAGENAISVKIEFAGKISIMVLSIPIIADFLEVISLLLEKI